MAVMIDIPGVGTVEAKGAASEATLRELLKVMGGKPPGGGPGAGGAGGGGGGDTKGPNLLGKTFGMLGKAVGMTVGAMGLVTTGAKAAAGAATGLAEAGIGAADALSRLDGSASGVAQIFSGIPLFGKAFTAVAGAADDVVKSYNAVSQTGASFGGSISNFAKSASEAGMTMDQFAAVIKANGQGMMGFGTTVEGGAANFAKVSKQLRATSGDLYALGYSTQDINNGLAKYGDLLKQQGLQGKKSNAELAQGAKAYLKEIDLLAKVTGEERSQVESRMAAMAKDAQFQASMAGLGENVRNSFLAVTGGLPKGLDDFAKDIMSTGTATTEENQKLMAMMPQSAAMLQQMNAKMQRGEAVTLDERNRLNNLMKEEGAKNLKNIKSAGAASSDLSGTVNKLSAAASMNTDSLKQGTEEQKKAAAEEAKMNEKMQAFQARIAEVGNSFKMLLANSGILDVMMMAFDGLVKIANQYLIPAFNIITSVVMKVANGISLLLQPALDYISQKFGASGLGGTVEWIDGLMNTAFEFLDGAMRGAILAFDGLWDGIQSVIEPFRGLMNAIFGTGESAGSFGEILIDVGAFVGDALRVFGKALGWVIEFITPAVKFVVDAFKGLWSVTKTVIDFFSNFGDHLADFGDSLSSLIDGILAKLGTTFGGISDEEKKKRDDARAAAKEGREAEKKARETSKVTTAEQHKAALKEDKKQFAEKKVTHDKLTSVAKKEAEAKEAAVKAQEKLLDYNAGPEELLKAFSGKEGGTVEMGVKKEEAQKDKLAADKELAEAKTTAEKKAALAKVEEAEKKIAALDAALKLAKEGGPKTANAAPKDQKSESSTKAEGAKKEIEAGAEKKKQDEAKAKEEADKKAKEEADKKSKESEDKKKGSTQESAETLLAELNTKMGQLLKINQEQKDINERQLTAQKGMSKNLFA